MMNLKEGLALAAGLMLMASAALAETKSGSAGSFSDLSPGNQNIARALFYAQHPAANGPQPLSMNQIAALKGQEGWGEVFKQMKAEGLVNEKNLGEVVSSYEHHRHDTRAASSNGRTTVTTGNGHAFASGSDNGHAQTGKSGDAGSEGAEHGLASADHGHDVTVSTAGGATNAGGASASSAGGAGAHGGATGHAH
ncbi:MAG TPA: hypothetical protein VGU20_25525 [Stellaceae bacterium]|nr:hypothetical protein [Stellaceae bacterium]